MNIIFLLKEYNIRATCINIAISTQDIVSFKVFLQLYNIAESDNTTPKLNSLN